ncbi:Sepiapterin reductase [Halotydeus destructor]|nr:Sepiapterin reductase [Halotydeus destructor]
MASVEESSSKASLWKQNVCVTVTGASRGIGRTIAIEFAKSFHDQHQGQSSEQANISFILMARDEEAITEVECLIKATGDCVSKVILIPGSLSEFRTIQQFEDVMKELSSQPFDQVVLVHNAGSLGNQNQLTSDYSSSDMEYLANYWQLNFNSVVALTGAFISSFIRVPSKLVINITSLLALQAFKGLSMYSSGKAAREAFFRSVAHEHADIRVLNYSPGPVETDMHRTLRASSHVMEMFDPEKNLVLTTDTTVKQLLNILEADSFENGAHVDYFDA